MLVRRALLVLLALIVLLLAVPGAFMALNIPIDLDLLKSPLTKLASEQLGLDVRIEGHMRLIPGLEPTFEMQGLTVSDPGRAGDDNTIQLGLARVQLALLPLMVGGISIEELTAEDIQVVAVIGRNDSASARPAPSTHASEPESTAPSDGSDLLFQGLANLALRRVSVDVRNTASGKHHRLVLDEMTGAAAANQPLTLKARGSYQQQPFRLEMRGETIDKILLLTWSWPLDMSAEIAGMTIRLASVDARDTGQATLDYTLSISGQRFDELDEVIGISLPPLGPYSIAGRFSIFDDRYTISDFALGLGESDLKGSVDVEVAGALPRVAVDLTADALHLEDFDIGDWSPADSEAAPEAAVAAPTDDGSRTVAALFDSEILKSLSLHVSLAVKKIESRTRQFGSGSMQLRLDGGIIELDPLNIELPQGPLEFAMLLDPASQLDAAAMGLLPVSVSAKIPGTVLRFDRAHDDSSVSPERLRELRYRMQVEGENLDRFDNYVGVSLPPVGPYTLTTLISARDTHYALSELDIRIGDSDLKGELFLDTSGDRPRTEVHLVADVLQLEDFIFDDWMLVEGSQEPQPREEHSGRDSINALLSRESMSLIDASFTLDVGQVLLGKEEMGSGNLGVTLEGGRLDLKPLRLDIPGGGMNTSLAFEPFDDGFFAQAAIDIDRFDYGVLARRQKPGTDMGGYLSLDAALESRTDTPENLLRNANGHLLLGIWPDNIEADVFDLWTVNLLLAVMPTVDEGPRSNVNCIVAGLEFRDGVATQKSLLFDTTNMQVSGEISADFNNEQVDVFLRPQAKVPQFFALATPVQVDGDFSDFGVSPAPGALIGTVIRVLTSIVTVPVERLFRESPPEDGEVACAVAFQGGVPDGR